MQNLTTGVWIETDDAAVKRILVAHDRAEAIEEAAKLGQPRAFIVWETRRAIFVCIHFTGYSDAQDNGYTLVVIDKETHSPESARAIVEKVLSFVEKVLSSGRDETKPTTGWQHVVYTPAAN